MLSGTGYFVFNNHWYNNHINTIKKTYILLVLHNEEEGKKRKRRKNFEVNRPGNISDYSTTLGALLNVVIQIQTNQGTEATIRSN